MLKITYRKGSALQAIKNILIKNRIYPYTNKRKFETLLNGTYYSGVMGNLIDRHVALYGCYEKHVCEFLRAAAEFSGGANRCMFADIGANKGHHSLFLSQFVKSIQAFEPYEPIADEFSELILKGNIGNINLNRVGLSDQPEDLMFFPPKDDNRGVGSFDPENFEVVSSGIRLTVRRGDEFFEGKGLHLVKIDVEGFEKKTLSGLVLTLAKERPIVCFEHKSRDPLPVQEFKNLFPENYVFYTFEQASRSDIRKQREDGIWRLALVDGISVADDYVAIPQELFASAPPERFGPENFSTTLKRLET